MNPIAFLDFDGVICTNDSYLKADIGDKPFLNPHANLVIVPELVANVQKLCDVTGASIIISSAWRKLHPHDTIEMWLREKGLTTPVLGYTGDGHKPRMSEYATRSSEIQRWLNSHVSERFVVLDDDLTCRHFGKNWIQCKFYGPEQGFTYERLQHAIGALNA